MCPNIIFNSFIYFVIMQLLKFLPIFALVVLVSSCQNIGTPSSPKAEMKDSLNLEGELGPGYLIRMTLHIFDDHTVTGAYQYVEGYLDNMTYLKGNLSDGCFALAEFSIVGEQTGTFNGTFDETTFRGRYESRTDSIDFVLTTAIDTLGHFIDSFDMINFDTYKIVYSDYAIKRMEINKWWDESEYIYEPAYYSLDYDDERFEEILKDFEEYVNNFDKNDEVMMNELGPKMTEYLMYIRYYMTDDDWVLPRQSVKHKENLSYFNSVLETLSEKLL